MDLLDNRTTWHDFLKKKPKRIHMISNIKSGYDLLYFEKHGKRYFDLSPFRPHKFSQPPKAVGQEQEGLPW